MKKHQQDEIDQLTRELLKRSMLTPVSKDFDESLMKKIMDLPTPAATQSNGNETRKAWRLWMIAIVCLIVSLFVVSEFLTTYFAELSKMLTVTLNYVFYGGMALFIPFVLFQLDSLLQVSSWQKRKLT